MNGKTSVSTGGKPPQGALPRTCEQRNVGVGRTANSSLSVLPLLRRGSDCRHRGRHGRRVGLPYRHLASADRLSREVGRPLDQVRSRRPQRATFSIRVVLRTHFSSRARSPRSSSPSIALERHPTPVLSAATWMFMSGKRTAFNLPVCLNSLRNLGLSTVARSRS